MAQESSLQLSNYKVGDVLPDRPYSYYAGYDRCGRCKCPTIHKEAYSDSAEPKPVAVKFCDSCLTVRKVSPL